jgi:co-chaperonin GroES (HSP10)
MAKKTAKAQEPKVKRELVADYDTLILTELPRQEMSSGGIYIPESVDPEEAEDIRSGIIIEIGPSSNPNRPFRFKVGDQVSWGKYQGRKFAYEGVDYLLCRHLDLLMGIVEVK